MMKHKSTAISGVDLFNRIDRDTDTPWYELLDCAEADRARIFGTWYLATWPEHVLTPRYNGDAHYRACASESEAREAADAVYGE